MKNPTKNSEAYITELEDKIIDLSLKLKKQTSLLETNNSKHNQLLNKLTHNLKNPIGNAFCFSEMMLEDLDVYTQEKLEKHLNIIKDTSKYAIDLLNNFSIFQGINNPDCVYSFKKTTYTDLVEETKDKISNNTQRNITILTEETAKNAFEITIDDEKIALALKQIIDNAVRFSNKESNVTIAITTTNTSIETVITDKGIGISEKNLDNVFKDFFTVDKYDLERKKCIGLGLPLAQKIIKKHNGTLSIKSILNEGTTVKLTLPKSV
ncbi:HAMP domain-containing histidine kinase [Lutibacter sp. A80]|uniref:sensor histidine kinase n=1 Tax=Lutibacter sp. A80 TaxID=2918453 RepID=UPI001F05FA21|nr:HAMP domain-containing sensor histidine kinase [Lutibacter sp. A80]UMB59675.1 HAMP domain-containing histidine kinase [Lutibacter sp. A80]